MRSVLTGIRAGSFGIGTSLSNDFKKASNGAEKSRALNMVIKLSSVDGKPTVKISDDITKVGGLSITLRSVGAEFFRTVQNTGEPETVRQVKGIFGIPVTDKDEVTL